MKTYDRHLAYAVVCRLELIPSSLHGHEFSVEFKRERCQLNPLSIHI